MCSFPSHLSIHRAGQKCPFSQLIRRYYITSPPHVKIENRRVAFWTRSGGGGLAARARTGALRARGQMTVDREQRRVPRRIGSRQDLLGAGRAFYYDRREAGGEGRETGCARAARLFSVIRHLFSRAARLPSPRRGSKRASPRFEVDLGGVDPRPRPDARALPPARAREGGELGGLSPRRRCAILAAL